jgi:hypothetical protein
LRGQVEPTPGERYGMDVPLGWVAGSGGSARDGIRAYHGSPHQFDRFDMSRIGTGEGAQAYGHGLYFAGNEGVARSYRDALTAKVNPRTGINNLLDNVGFGATRSDIEEAVAGLGLRLQKTQLDDIAAALGGRNSDGTVTDSALNALRRLDDSLPKTQGHMYEVRLNTTPDRLLDWDAPISQQSPEIQPVLRQMLESARKSFSGIDASGNPIAGQVHHLYQQHRGGHSDFVAEKLREAGIPGIQYLDAGSRAAGDGTRNYVMFDDKLIDILRRYGLAGMLAGGAASQAQAGEPAP